jgi:hypothetical protein
LCGVAFVWFAELVENPLVLPFRISYIDYHTPIKRQKERSATLWTY